MFEELQGREVSSIGESAFRNYAVMVPLVEKDGEICVLFEKRSMKLDRQPGEISFPGGSRDQGEDSQENAVRETMEELLIGRDQIHVIAQMDTLFTLRDKVSVYLCQLCGYQMTFSKDETEEVFLVPLRFFMETPADIYMNDLYIKPDPKLPFDKIPGGENYGWRGGRSRLYFYYYKDYVIWGMTACIMNHVVEILREEAGLTVEKLDSLQGSCGD